MHDAGKVIVGLAVFLAVVTSPVWYQAAKGAVAGPPDLKIKSESPVCVAETSYMRSLHMDLLDNWRDDAVRNGDRVYVGLGGVEYDKSLEGTCLGRCHSNQEEFCDRCHEYVGADVYCWECHAEQKGESVADADESELESAARLERMEFALGVSGRPTGN
jgi:hypothetical protein